MERTILSANAMQAPKKVSKTWEAAQRYKGSIEVHDKSILD